MSTICRGKLTFFLVIFSVKKKLFTDIIMSTVDLRSIGNLNDWIIELPETIISGLPVPVNAIRYESTLLHQLWVNAGPDNRLPVLLDNGFGMIQAKGEIRVIKLPGTPKPYIYCINKKIEGGATNYEVIELKNYTRIYNNTGDKGEASTDIVTFCNVAKTENALYTITLGSTYYSSWLFFGNPASMILTHSSTGISQELTLDGGYEETFDISLGTLFDNDVINVSVSSTSSWEEQYMWWKINHIDGTEVLSSSLNNQDNNGYGAPFDGSFTAVISPSTAAQFAYDEASANVYLTSFVTGATQPCLNYRVEMVDSCGDGWDDNTLSIYVNGVLVESGITLSGWTSQGSYDFSLNEAVAGDIITVECDGGAWQHEVEWEIIDLTNNNTIVLTGGAPFAQTDGSFTITSASGLIEYATQAEQDTAAAAAGQSAYDDFIAAQGSNFVQLIPQFFVMPPNDLFGRTYANKEFSQLLLPDNDSGFYSTIGFGSPHTSFLESAPLFITVENPDAGGDTNWLSKPPAAAIIPASETTIGDIKTWFDSIRPIYECHLDVIYGNLETFYNHHHAYPIDLRVSDISGVKAFVVDGKSYFVGQTYDNSYCNICLEYESVPIDVSGTIGGKHFKPVITVTGLIEEDISSNVSPDLGSRGNVFNIINTSGKDLTITAFNQGCDGYEYVGVDMEVYYHPGDYTDGEGSVLTSLSWTLLAQASVDLNDGLYTGIIPVDITIPANTTYAFAIGSVDGTTIRYMRAYGTAGLTPLVTGDYFTLTEGHGSSSVTATTFSPRSWNGSISYSLSAQADQPIQPWLSSVALKNSNVLAKIYGLYTTINGSNGYTGGMSFTDAETFLDSTGALRNNLVPLITTMALNLPFISIGMTGGDPYVTPIYGLQYKLPDREACYRLFERGDVFINGLVKEASKQKQKAIRDYAEGVHAKYSKTLGVAEALKMLSLDNVLLNGYFFDSFFIYSEGHAVFVDLQNKEFKSKENTQDYFTIKQQEHKSTNNGSSNNLFQESKYTKVTVNWRHSKFGKMNSFVSFYDNPQIDNGMTITKSMTTKDCVGLLMYNYKPKLMEIPTLTTLTHKKLHKRLKNAKNKFVNKNIILKKEEWKSIAAKTVKTIENKDIKKC